MWKLSGAAIKSVVSGVLGPNVKRLDVRAVGRLDVGGCVNRVCVLQLYFTSSVAILSVYGQFTRGLCFAYAVPLRFMQCLCSVYSVHAFAIHAA